MTRMHQTQRLQPAQGTEQHAASRRRFLRTATGAAALLAGPSLPSTAQAASSADPLPIPGGFAALGHFYHVLAPGHPFIPFAGPAGVQDPSTITHFNGHVGLAYVRGMGTHLDKTTGSVRRLPYEVDLRFMEGTYVGKDGKNHHRTFGFM